MFRKPKKTFSVDLDSTLCDTRHRKGVVEKYKNAGLDVDWDDYAQHCINDAPTGMVAVCLAWQAAGIPWIVVSGRSEGARVGTVKWLAKHGLKPERIFLEGVGRSMEHTEVGHVIFKTRRVLESAASVETDGFEVVAHFDDWAPVAESIREASHGKIDVVTVTPPGAVVTIPTPDNPGEAHEVL